MKIGIMGAMREEIEPLFDYFSEINAYEIGGNTYYEGKYKEIEIVFAYSKIGKVFASLTASVLIMHFGVKKLLFSGVAGAVNPLLKIGDLVIAKKVCQHDLDISAFGHPLGFVPEGKIFIDCDEKLNSLARSIAKKQGVKLIEGIIATGDQFVANPEKKEWIKNIFNADAIEMEGAAVGVICDSFKIPFLISISEK